MQQHRSQSRHMLQNTKARDNVINSDDGFWSTSHAASSGVDIVYPRTLSEHLLLDRHSLWLSLLMHVFYTQGDTSTRQKHNDCSVQMIK